MYMYLISLTVMHVLLTYFRDAQLMFHSLDPFLKFVFVQPKPAKPDPSAAGRSIAESSSINFDVRSSLASTLLTTTYRHLPLHHDVIQWLLQHLLLLKVSAAGLKIAFF